MIQLTDLALQHFRNHSSFHIRFNQPTLVIVGDNAQGKTSILEAINLLSTGQSFRADKVEEMVSLGQELGRVKGKVRENLQFPISNLTIEEQSSEDSNELEIILTRGMVQGKKTHSRLFSVNNVRRRKQDFVGQFFTVSFRPEDMRLMEGSPSRRRNFMDVPLSTIYPSYAESLNTYEQALKRRNKLLVSVKEGQMPRSVLTYWTLQLLKHGQLIQKYRTEFLHYFSTVDFPMVFTIEYQPSLMTEERMAYYADNEIASGHTLIGPHKDDFDVQMKSELDPSATLSVATYGSRGQQRMAVLWLKVCELEFIQTKKNLHPILLLDDILSELDHTARERVMSLLGNSQAVVTTTEPKIVDEIKERLNDIQVLTLPV